MIGSFEKIFKDIYSYFSDLRLTPVYFLFERIFKMMVLGYKTLSELLLCLVKKKNKPFQDTEESEKWKRNSLDL